MCCTAWWLCVMIASQPSLAQDDNSSRCYNLTTTTHCFKTARGPDKLTRNFTSAVSWCAAQGQGYGLVKIESAEVQAAVEQYLEEFELTSDDVWISAQRKTQKQWTWVNNDLLTNGNFLLP